MLFFFVVFFCDIHVLVYEISVSDSSSYLELCMKAKKKKRMNSDICQIGLYSGITTIERLPLFT